MKNKISVLMSFCVMFNYVTSQDLIAQSNNDAIVGASAIIAGLAISSAVSNAQIEELLEARATDFIMTEYPEINKFRLKVIEDDVEKWTNDNNIEIVAFNLSILENPVKILEKRILLMYSNDYGQGFELINKDEWNSMLSFFANLLGIGDVKENTLTMYNTSKCKKEGAVELRFFNNLGSLDRKCYVMSNENRHISNLILTKNSFVDIKNTFNVYPLNRLRGDDYFVGDFNSKFRLFANEGTMGLFIKSINRTVLLRSYTIGEMHHFINDRSGNLY